MSSFDRRKFLLTCASFGALTGCGFTPVYAPGRTGAALRGRVEIDAPDTRESYTLYNRLTDSFGLPEAPLYRLRYKISTTKHEIGLTRDQEITRYHIEGKVNYTLSEIQSGQPLLTHSLSSFTAYSATGSAVDTLTASRDAYARLMTILGDQMVNHIIASVETRA